MAKVVVGVTLSLDGFASDRNGDLSRLNPDQEALRNTEMLQEEIATTGAVVMGRRSYDLAQGDLTGYDFQVPIFVLTHHLPAQPPKGQNDRLSVHFVTDGVESAVAQAKVASGDQYVMVIGGADTTRQCLRAGLVDEISIGIAPVLLGDGLRWFEAAGVEPLELEQIKVYESPGRTDVRFRVVK